MINLPRARDSQANRAQGALYGLAIGDALGMPTQLLSRPQIVARWGPLLTGYEAACLLAFALAALACLAVIVTAGLKAAGRAAERVLPMLKPDSASWRTIRQVIRPPSPPRPRCYW